MTEWHWKTRRDSEGTFLETVEPGREWARLYIFDGAEYDSVSYGHKIVSVVTELSPIQARLYRLVYGSLP